MRGRIEVAVSLALSLAGLCLAQTPEEDAELAAMMGDSVSLATGRTMPLRRAPSVATVITADDIAATGATDLDQVLETVPGLHVSRSSILNQPIYMMRGIRSGLYNPHLLLLQNGVPMTTLYSGDKGGNWGGLPLENIARIEILRAGFGLVWCRCLCRCGQPDHQNGG